MAIVSTVDLRGGPTLSYAHQGTAHDPSLVLLPGPTDSWRSYQPVLDRLAPSVHAVGVSMRGHGDSDKPATGYRVESYAGDVVDVLDALGVGRAVLAGHSGSCLVARRVALDHPARVAGLVLEASPTTLRGNAQLLEVERSVVAGLADPISPDVASAFVRETSSGNVPPVLLDELVAEVMKVPARVWQETFADLREYDDVEDLPRIEAPTLLVWGEADSLIPRAMQDELVRRLPAAELVVYRGVGHTPRWEDPSRFARDASAFVARVART